MLIITQIYNTLKFAKNCNLKSRENFKIANDSAKSIAQIIQELFRRKLTDSSKEQEFKNVILVYTKSSKSYEVVLEELKRLEVSRSNLGSSLTSQISVSQKNSEYMTVDANLVIDQYDSVEERQHDIESLNNAAKRINDFSKQQLELIHKQDLNIDHIMKTQQNHLDTVQTEINVELERTKKSSSEKLKQVGIWILIALAIIVFLLIIMSQVGKISEQLKTISSA